MGTTNKHRVSESFGDFIDSTERMQNPYEPQSAKFGANPDDNDQLELPFEFEMRPEIGEEARSSELTLMLEKIQAIADAGVNKSKKVSEVSPYITRQLELAYKHLREGYLRLMDM